MKKRDRMQRPSFTLIELLVVIAIIAILVSMLLPALSEARYSAKSALCISQIKQHALAANSYAGDFDSFIFPVAGDAYGYNFDWCWAPDYIKSTSILHCPCGPKDNLTNPATGNKYYYIKGPGIVPSGANAGKPGCRFAVGVGGFQWHEDWVDAATGYSTQYNSDYKFRTPFCSLQITGNGNNRNRVLPRSSKIDKCSNLAAISCGMKIAFKYCDMKAYTYLDSAVYGLGKNDPHKTHRRGFNVGFYDGSASFKSYNPSAHQHLRRYGFANSFSLWDRGIAYCYDNYATVAGCSITAGTDPEGKSHADAKDWRSSYPSDSETSMLHYVGKWYP